MKGKNKARRTGGRPIHSHIIPNQRDDQTKEQVVQEKLNLSDHLTEITDKKLPSPNDVGSSNSIDKLDEAFLLALAETSEEDKNDLILFLFSHFVRLRKELSSSSCDDLSSEEQELIKLRKEKEECYKTEKDRLEYNIRQAIASNEDGIETMKRNKQEIYLKLYNLHKEQDFLKGELIVEKQKWLEIMIAYEEALENEKELLQSKRDMEKELAIMREERAEIMKNKTKKVGDLEKAKVMKEQAEVRFNQELKLTNKALAEVEVLRKGKAKIKANEKAEKKRIWMKGEKDKKIILAQVDELEKDVAKLKLNEEKKIIDQLRKTFYDEADGSSGSTSSSKAFTHFRDSFIIKDDRECVICLEEEKCVVMLSCGHQVLCVKCNELHKNGGCNDCPTCRSPIFRRVPVRFLDG
ncbi:hypothetical protein ACFE04_031555 [Oxalis oulophora]